MFHVIRAANVDDHGTLRIEFVDGSHGSISLPALAATGGVFASLTDAATRTHVTIGERGRFLEWPGGIDLCADALWLEVHGQGDLLVADSAPDTREIRCKRTRRAPSAPRARKQPVTSSPAS